jgi:hypothetical protein
MHNYGKYGIVTYWNMSFLVCMFCSEDLLETMIAIGSKRDSSQSTTLGLLTVALDTPTTREFSAL